MKGKLIINDEPSVLKLDFNNDSIFDSVKTGDIFESGSYEDWVNPNTVLHIEGEVGLKSWYTSSTTVTILAEDKGSGLLRTYYALSYGSKDASEGEREWHSYTNPLVLPQDGYYSLSYYSIDREGNNEPVKTAKIKIDKTPPELSMYFDKNKRDVVFEASDNLTSNILPEDKGNRITAKDEAGNSVEMVLKDKDRKHSLKAEIKSLSYNGKPTDISRNKLNFAWLYDKKNQLTHLLQSVQSKKEFFILALFNGKKTIITGLDKSGLLHENKQGLALLKVFTRAGDLKKALS